MGKCISKRNLEKDKNFTTEEDRIISSFEKKAPFAAVKLDMLEKAFEEHQFDKRLTMPDLRLALSEMGLDPEQLKNPQSHFSKYFEAMLEPDRLFYQRKLVLSAVLTSGESDQRKVKLIRKHYDLNNNDEISQSEVEVLLEEIIQISIKIMPMMAVRDSMQDENDLISQEQLENYNFNLQKVSKSYKKKLLKKIMKGQDSVDADTFEAAFQREYLKVALCSSSVRNKIRMMFKERMRLVESV